MFLRFETIPEKKLIGKRMNMSLAEGTTPMLWKGFMQQRHEIANAAGTDLFSIQVYHPPFDVHGFGPHTRFEKWAAAEVTDFNTVPEGMEPFPLPGGLYAVFLHRGGPSTARETFGYIFGTWLPASGLQLDDRPHFEVLGARYSNTSPDSEEELWIPVK